MKKKKIIIAAFALLALLLIGGATAYFMDTKTLTNTFTMGNVQIALSETNFNSNNANGVMPGATILKNPAITNTGASPAFVFIRVTEPCYGDKKVFLYEYSTNSSAWKVVGTPGSCSGTGVSTTQTVYAYAGEINTEIDNQPVTVDALSTLQPEDTTYDLFYAVQVNPALDATAVTALNNSTVQIVIDGYGIQADNVPARGDGSKDPATIWALFPSN